MLSDNDVKSELSYAWLHAVAARAGCECQATARHSDNRGIDARLMAAGRFGPAPSLTLFDVYVQLKATSEELSPRRGLIPFDLEVPQYDRLRVTTVASPWLLVVLQLPAEPTRWLSCSPQGLSLRRCAWWVSLHGAPEAQGTHTQRVYIPRRNRFTVETLHELLPQFAREERIPYAP